MSSSGAVSYDGASGLLTNTASTATCYQATCPAGLRLPSLSVVWQGTQLGTPSNFSRIFGCSYDNTEVSPYSSWNLGVDNAPNYALTFSSTGLGFARAVSTTPAAAVGSPVFLVGRLNPAASGGEIFVNGSATSASATLITGVSYGTNPLLTFGEPPSLEPTRSPMVAHDYALIYNRIISTVEMARLYASGRDLFARRRDWVGWTAALLGTAAVGNFKLAGPGGLVRGMAGRSGGLVG